MQKIISPGLRKGIVHIPASKSDCQRALLAAGLSKGTSTLTNVGTSNDEQAMLHTIQQLGAKVKHLDGLTYEITGLQNFPTKTEINVGESGLGVRLLSSVVSAFKGEHTLIGHGSLCTRPLPFFEDVLPQLGAKVKSNNGYVPLTIEGPIQGGNLSVDGSQSSQYISGLLMALCQVNGDTQLEVRDLNSIPYLQMTLATLEKFGISIAHENFKDFTILGNQTYKSCQYNIESDWSSASYWLVASAIGMDIQITGLSMSSLQADKALLDAFVNANCKVIMDNNQLKIDGTKRVPFEFDATHCPDLFPALVTFAAAIKGLTKIKGVSRLAHKESDRGIVLQEEFKKLGVKIDLLGDEMHIHGTGQLEGGNTHSHHDHRIAMCLGVAAFYAKSEIVIETAEAVEKSYPTFWDDLEELK